MGGRGSFLWFKTMLSVPVGGGEGERVGNVCACFVRGYVSATGGFFFFSPCERRGEEGSMITPFSRSKLSHCGESR